MENGKIVDVHIYFCILIHILIIEVLSFFVKNKS